MSYTAATGRVSIHALLAECDKHQRRRKEPKQCFNPRTPCGVRQGGNVINRPLASFNPRTPCGVRHRRRPGKGVSERFQSTHSLRSATVFFRHLPLRRGGFNPRTPCGVRLHGCNGTTRRPLFQSTHSLRSATGEGAVDDIATLPCFNPRTPCGVRLIQSTKLVDKARFQSTHSLRSATDPDDMATFLRDVSIHALLAECDKWAFGFVSTVCCFNPRTPCGVRHDPDDMATFLRDVSIHALLAECDTGDNPPDNERKVSIHALLAECDRVA